MKSPSAYYLLLLYLTLMLKPLIPIISDAWSHEFKEIEHISSVHLKYGSHHLQNELADTSSDNNEGKNQNTLKVENEVSFHISPLLFNFDFAISSSNIKYRCFRLNKLPFVFISNQGPPPKFS